MIKTINVIEMINDEIQKVYSFDAFSEGFVPAEKMFIKLVEQKEKYNEQVIRMFVDEGFFEYHGYKLFLVTSE